MARYRSAEEMLGCDRRRFLGALGAGTVVVGGAVLGVAEEPTPSPSPTATPTPPAEVETNIDEFMKVPRGPPAIPGPFPGRVVRSPTRGRWPEDRGRRRGGAGDGRARGSRDLTGTRLKESFGCSSRAGRRGRAQGQPGRARRSSTPTPRWSTRSSGGSSTTACPRRNIVIWDRFDGMLEEAGFTAAALPGRADRGAADHGRGGAELAGRRRRPRQRAGNFDREAFYFARALSARACAATRTTSST